MNSDKKIKLHSNHENQVEQILFVGKENEYLLSLDKKYNVSLFATEIKTFQRITQFYLPLVERDYPLISVSCCFINNLLVINENEFEGGYRTSIWSLNNRNFELLFIKHLETVNFCVNCHFFNKKYVNEYVIIEKSCIKYWKIESNEVSIKNRIHVNENIIQSQINYFSNVLFFLTNIGKIYIINHEVNIFNKILLLIKII